MARTLYNRRRKLLAGLMMAEAEPWDDVPEDAKERWRRTTDRHETSETAA